MTSIAGSAGPPLRAVTDPVRGGVTGAEDPAGAVGRESPVR
jgi:hypothetical protein